MTLFQQQKKEKKYLYSCPPQLSRFRNTQQNNLQFWLTIKYQQFGFKVSKCNLLKTYFCYLNKVFTQFVVLLLQTFLQ